MTDLVAFFSVPSNLFLLIFAIGFIVGFLFAKFDRFLIEVAELASLLICHIRKRNGNKIIDEPEKTG